MYDSKLTGTNPKAIPHDMTSVITPPANIDEDFIPYWINRYPTAPSMIGKIIDVPQVRSTKPLMTCSLVGSGNASATIAELGNQSTMEAIEF
jgi:hypothetical protein